VSLERWKQFKGKQGFFGFIDQVYYFHLSKQVLIISSRPVLPGKLFSRGEVRNSGSC
jgi:hypothetical protein